MDASAHATALIVFAIVYAAMAVGHLPGLQVDRTGAALVGALVLIATGTIGSHAAWNAIDYRTMGLLFGLMIVSSAFVVSGFYAWVRHGWRPCRSGPGHCSPCSSAPRRCCRRCSPTTWWWSQ